MCSFCTLFFSKTFPPKVPDKMKDHIESRVKLLSREELIIEGGSNAEVGSNVFIKDKMIGKTLMLKANTAIPLVFQEEYIHPCPNSSSKQQIFVKFSNLSTERKIIPAGCLIGYVIIS